MFAASPFATPQAARPAEYLPAARPPLGVRQGSLAALEFQLDELRKVNDSLRSAAEFDRAAPYVLPSLANPLIFPFEQLPGRAKPKSKRINSGSGCVSTTEILAHCDASEAAEATAEVARAAKKAKLVTERDAYDTCALGCVCDKGFACAARILKLCSVCGELKKSACSKRSCKETIASRAVAPSTPAAATSGMTLVTAAVFLGLAPSPVLPMGLAIGIDLCQ